jgi:7-cyano-7-deazaguanine synthase
MKTVLVFSGGMDSTTLLYKLLRDGDAVECVSFDYGQRHKKELECAKGVCKMLAAKGALPTGRQEKVSHEIVDIRSAAKILMGGSALTSAKIAVPEGHYKAKTMKSTVVPNRNMVFLALAIARAVTLKADRVAIGVHAGDHAIYPDCRPAFIKLMRAAASSVNYEKVDVYAPFLNKTKRQIATLGKKLGVPFEKTWTCYRGLAKPCGKCGACVERAEALE